MRTTTHDNLTQPGNDSTEKSLLSTNPEGACVDCGEYVPAFREHFLTHYAPNGSEYGRYSAAYELGHKLGRDNHDEDWQSAEHHLRTDWERRGQGPWEDFMDAIRFGWHKGAGKK